ncbi:endonuclease/exonuclease/phosphatase family metal-dependent hydrolase [Anseongella ginsenosidimutans]|uniref:Endonuclease/exonuclease/phosphatase family metal-dependent hydrolase n=1 Tax=Anseongella ginsenosidimutans TaxID=496056 RepID=A0A4V2UUB7_9SPHI|nr:endonuclease/exonuclease/phosphatase family protein [Anseongella ginsenosidimutans]QEC51466.1 endonuclease/exonuclease/phosphatase family protein [Anseongella ginsenosidimutans]TCS89823.1 endonuclease/exonuclease/phosphatase family metal-dependent hydrolase [Anseongella ginsenosidimutans]
MSLKKITSLLILIITLPLLSIGQELTVASYNIRYANEGDAEKGDGWESRLPVITSQVLFFDFDLMGVQEALESQLIDLDGQLEAYDRIGVGRKDGKTGGEYSPIFYKKDRFKLLDHATFWLSETPETPSKGWDAALNRICTWGKFRDNESKKEFFYFNLHMDHKGQEARKNSTLLVLEKIREIAGNAPVILSGDFNFDQDHPNYKLIAGSGFLEDTYELAPIRMAPNGTFNQFNFNNTGHDRRIDHIFINKKFTANRFGILTGSYKGHFPSDHFPVVVELEMR